MDGIKGDSSRTAAALLIGSVMVSRSPSDALGLVRDIRAKGQFTTTGLGVTTLIAAAAALTFTVVSSVATDMALGNSGSGIWVSMIISLVLSPLIGLFLWALL